MLLLLLLPLRPPSGRPVPMPFPPLEKACIDLLPVSVSGPFEKIEGETDRLDAEVPVTEHDGDSVLRRRASSLGDVEEDASRISAMTEDGPIPIPEADPAGATDVLAAVSSS